MPDTFSAMRYFLVVGEKMPSELAIRARRNFKLDLCESYTVTEASCPIAICTPAPPSENNYILPTGNPGSVGATLPGIALKITALHRPDLSLAPTDTGLIWLSGSAIVQQYLSQDTASSTNIRGKWFCTGDVGSLNEEGLLTISGRHERFSQIGDDLVPHEILELEICRILRIDPAENIRRIAIVGVPDPQAPGDKLVLLSTVHRAVNPHDTITLHYELLGARRPSSWTPRHIIAVKSIPTLPNGKLDYPRCYEGTCKMLGIDPNS